MRVAGDKGFLQPCRANRSPLLVEERKDGVSGYAGPTSPILVEEWGEAFGSASDLE